MTPEARDRQIRLAAFAWLDQQLNLRGDGPLPWQLLVRGFEIEGTRIPLASQPGIFKPAAMPHMPLSIRTSVNGPYDDHLPESGLFRYRFRGEDPELPDNRRLRATIAAKVPLIYLFGVVPGRYVAQYPVYIVGEDRGALTFFMEAHARDDIQRYAKQEPEHHDIGRTQLERRYATVAAVRRLHQQAFRDRVLEAYQTHCALCRLRHESLLDAAHIIPDSEAGPAAVSNGIALCKIHHAAYDRHFLSVRPDYTVEIRQSLLQETDGPMLQHGIKAMHDQQIVLPSRISDRPDRSLLERRHIQFVKTLT